MVAPRPPGIDPSAPGWFQRWALRLPDFFMTIGEGLSSTGPAPKAVLTDTATAGATATLAIIDNSGAPYEQWVAGSGIVHRYYDAPDHIFRSALGVEWGRLTATGLGLGVAPTHRLDIAGSFSASGANPRIFLSNTNGTASTLQLAADSGAVSVGSTTAAPVAIVVNAAEVARFTAIGLSVGTTAQGGWSSNAITVSYTPAGGGWALGAHNAATTAGGSGAFLARVDNTAQSYMGLYYQTGQTGSITTNGTSTAFNTTSDEQLKTFQGVYSPLDANALIRNDPVRAFVWNEHSADPGVQAVGWGAQTSYAASSDLATMGHGAPGDEDYRPWGVDQSKRTPYLWAAIGAPGGVLDRLDALQIALATVQSDLDAYKAAHP